MIKHVWFDVDGTLTVDSPEFKKALSNLFYTTYSEVTGKPITKELKQEYDNLYKQYGSNSAIFQSLGCPSNFMMDRFNALDKEKHYRAYKPIYLAVEKIKNKLPVSIFTSLNTSSAIKTLKILKIDPDWMTHFIGGDKVDHLKPALDGFHKLIELSNLPPEEIIYIGDREATDIIPAKELGIKTCLAWKQSDVADYYFTNFEELLNILQINK